MTQLIVFDTQGNASLLDLFEQETIALTFRFSDIQTFETTGGFTRNFRVPASDNNVAYFGAMFNPNNTSFDFRRKAEAALSVDGVPVANGHIQLLKVYSTGDVTHEFELVFYAETPNLARAVGDKKLADIAALDELDHEINYTEVTTAPADRGWFLVDRGQRWSEGGEPGTRPVLNPSQPLYASDLSPAVSYAYLFDNIIREAGFDWEGYDGSTALADRLALYYMPFVIDRFVQVDGLAQDEAFELGLSANATNIDQDLYLPSFNEVYDNGSNVSASVFTAPYTGFFQFKAWAKMTRDIIGSQVSWRIQFLRNNLVNTQSGNLTFQSNQQTMYGLHQPDPFFLNQGDTVQMRISRWFSDFEYDLLGDVNYDPANGTGWALIGASPAFAGQDIVYSRNAPDYKQIDLVRDIIRAHNCVVVPDRNIPNKLYIEPLASFIGAGASVDWSNKLDVSKDITLAPTTEYQSKKLLFTYKLGSDYASQFYQKEGGRIYGDYKVDGYTVNPSDAPNDFASGELKVELGIASTPCYAIAGTNIIIPKFTSDSGQFTLPGARMLFNSGTADIQLYDDITADAPVETAVYLLNHYDASFPDISDEDLNFAPEDPLYTGPAQVYNNLFNSYYRGPLNEIYDISARVMVAYFDLNLTDINQFSFADQIWIRDSYWRILEITAYNTGVHDMTQVTLIKIVNPLQDCEFKPHTISVGGVVTFINAEEETSSGNESCCSRYGYTWQTDRCYAFLPGAAPNSNSEQGTTGIGSSGNAPVPSLPGNFILSSGSDINPSVTQSAILGGGHYIEEGNGNMVLVGDALRVIGAQGAAALFGKNAVVRFPGLHLGGGWADNDRAGYQGRAQWGVILLSGAGEFTNNATQLPVYIDGITGKHIELFNNTTWACTAQVAIQQFAGGTVTGSEYGLFTFRIAKWGGIARIGTVHRVQSQGSLGTPDIVIDPSTDTDEQRLLVTLGGSGHPKANCFITISVQYTQVATDEYVS